MKNSLNLGFIALLLIVLGCSCPKLANLNFEEKSTPEPVSTPQASNIEPKTNTTNSASTSAALTIDKYNQLKNGMSYKEVSDILGGEGEEVSSTEIGSYKIVTYKWQGENYSFVIVTLRNDKVFSKSQSGLK